MPIPLGTLVGDWKKLLTDWGESGALTRAAREALMLEGEPEPLLSLLNQWGDGDFPAYRRSCYCQRARCQERLGPMPSARERFV